MRDPLPAAGFKAFSLAAAVLLAACSPSNGNSDAGVTPSTGCNTDQECADLHFKCDPLRRICVCTDDSMCTSADAPYCNAFTGKCVADIAGCKKDTDCGQNQYCDVALRTCGDKQPWCGSCTQDAECGGADDFCVENPAFVGSGTYCATACAADGTCPANQACVVTSKGKQCLPATGQCNAVSGCIPDSGQRCAVDADCTTGTAQVCDESIGRCVTGQTTCHPGEACDPTTFQCVAGCTSDAECVQRFTNTLYTCSNQACVLGDACHSDDDCADTTKFCLKPVDASSSDLGICALTCTQDTDCPLGELCETDASSNRASCVSGCHDGDDSGCPLNAICDSGQCESTGPGGVQRCQVKDVCAFKEDCVNNSCVAQPQYCKTCALDANCASGGGCGVFVTTTGSQIHRCTFHCTDDTSCPKGFYCIRVPIPNDPPATGSDQGPWCWPLVADYCQ